ncbi:LysM peptidoglycan-binding domain-containing protein [Comamonas composti]|uniref:LysM peptidoglycan-binding domain-containing protein n=1 Tax=Comamonas composti TaxID=408558 RepID=UPI00047954B4|nr:LysM peptidoglycan-binding domain-containing protein [Comamonas composti]
MTAYATVRAWTVTSALIAAFTGVHAQPYPVTPAQRATAQQVAQQGIPESELAPSAPDSYTVKQGDTLWGISGVFLRRPWRWPELWGMNLSSIANPHLIYPGQVLYLHKSNGYARLSTSAHGDGGVVRVSPRTRSESLASAALPTLQPHLIEPFLAEPLVVDAETLQRAPRLIAMPDKRMLMANGDRAYARGTEDAPLVRGNGLPYKFRVFRDAVALKDPVSGEILGYEAKYLGNADLLSSEATIEGDKGQVLSSPATVELTRVKMEMRAGDRLLPTPERGYMNYAPHAPTTPTQASVVSLYGDLAVQWAAHNQVVAINKGSSDGLDDGAVLELITRGARVLDKTGDKREWVQLPDEHNGYAMVFRTFERVSYALILEARRGVEVGDRLNSPAP